MENKKNPKADVAKNSSTYFLLGVACMVILSYYLIEFKTYDRKDVEVSSLVLEEELIEDIPITSTPPPPPPPPPPSPEVITVVENEVEIEETIIESTETSQMDFVEIVEIQEIEEVEEVIESVPFAVIENVPVFPGCEREKNNDGRKKCMSDKINEFVHSKFNTGLADDLGLTGRQRISVTFKINSKGDVVDVMARAPHPRLESEAKRVIQLLPKMTPGKQRGKAVDVPYSLPIIFQVE
ncbi:MAG TPA: energy transducer TonB [Flavobacteriaceae bacterium]|jgi:protein TonB|nr:energy transducer TonB [Flavobacteriaceae bacterium]